MNGRDSESGSSLTIRIPPTPLSSSSPPPMSARHEHVLISSKGEDHQDTITLFLSLVPTIFSPTHTSIPVRLERQWRETSWRESPQVCYPGRQEKGEREKIGSSLESEWFGRGTRIPPTWYSHLSKKERERESCPVFFFEEHFRKLLQTIQKPTTFTR